MCMHVNKLQWCDAARFMSTQLKAFSARCFDLESLRRPHLGEAASM